MNEGQIRDELALERTLLANERTLLAYVRTALALVGAGVVLIEFFSQRSSLVGIAWVLIPAGVATLAVGGFRFVAVRRRIERSRD